MGWIDKRLQNTKIQNQSEVEEDQADPAETSFESRAKRKWQRLLDGFQRDIDKFSSLDGSADFKLLSDFQCRISNPEAKIAVIVTADIPAQMIRYSYEPEDENTAVPEEGILTLRASNRVVELYSADQHVSSEQARQLILEPLLFPDRPASLQPTGT